LGDYNSVYNLLSSPQLSSFCSPYMRLKLHDHAPTEFLLLDVGILGIV